MQTCFILKRSVVGTFFTINSKEKPTVLAFTNKNNARYMLKHVVDFGNNGRKQQKIVVEEVRMNWFLQRCALNSLNVNIYEDNLTYECLQTPTDDYINKLENSYICH